MTTISDSNTRPLSTIPFQEQNPPSVSKLRILAIVLLVFSIIFIAGGVVLLTVVIPGLGAIISLGAGIGSCTLGGIMLSLGLFLLLRKREVPIVPVVSIPEEVVVDEESIRLKSEAEVALKRLPQELSLFEGYIKSVESNLETLKSVPYDGQGVSEKIKHRVRVLKSSLETMIPEFLDIRRILEEEEFFVISVHKDLRDFANSLISREILEKELSTDSLKEIASYLYFNSENLIKKLIDDLKSLTNEFIMLSFCFLQSLAVSERKEHNEAKRLFEKNQILLEQVIYGSLKKRYRKEGLVSAKMKILYDNAFFPLKGSEKTITTREKELTELGECLSAYRKVFLALSDTNVVDRPISSQNWDLSGILCRDKLAEISGDEQWKKKLILKERKAACALVESMFESQKALEAAQQSFLSSWKQFEKVEIEKARERVNTIQKFYPDIEPLKEEEAKYQENTSTETPLEDILSRIRNDGEQFQKEQKSCLEVLAKQAKKITETTPRSYGKGRELVENKIKSLEGFLKESSSKLEVIKKNYNKIRPYFKQEVSKREVQDARLRLEVLELELEGILSQIESVESLLTQEELPILAPRRALEKAIIKGSMCSALVMQAKPYFAEDSKFQDAATAFQDLTIRLQEVGEKLQEEETRFSNLETGIAEEKRLLEESKKTFERRGLGVLQEIATESVCDLQSLTNRWEKISETRKPYCQMYLKYYNGEKDRARTRVIEMTTRYRDFKIALETMQCGAEAFLEEEICIKDSSEQEESERNAESVASRKLQVAQSRLSDLESVTFRKSKDKKNPLKKLWSFRPSSKS
ncbi:DUF1978 domain-containing protein [Candidatus Chlamydia corallus]|uniref:DUF1978 domain-containing protein n=1 Tax=Candidatus Chlamydia corallus TaxID=2038470 RepID=UPI000C2F91EC|nr:DUF1978 domain-containing protein [Candidatus Chlamydia corallus]